MESCGGGILNFYLSKLNLSISYNCLSTSFQQPEFVELSFSNEGPNPSDLQDELVGPSVALQQPAPGALRDVLGTRRTPRVPVAHHTSGKSWRCQRQPPECHPDIEISLIFMDFE